MALVIALIGPDRKVLIIGLYLLLIAVACVACTRSDARSERRRHASLPRAPLFFWHITSMLLLHRLLAITDTELYISTFRHKYFATIFHLL